MSHIEILDMIARGMFGCPHRLPIDLDNWSQVRPAMRAAHDEIVSLRRQLTAANEKIERLRIACARYNHTISRIAYLLCQPNEMGWSAYDVTQDELWVIEQVRQLRAERDALLDAC